MTRDIARAAGEQLMTVEQFGQRLGVSRRTAYDIVADRQVDVIPVGTGKKRKQIRISEAALARYIKANEERRGSAA